MLSLTDLFSTWTIPTLQLPFALLLTKIDTNTIDTMSLILGVPEPLAFEDMSQVSSTVVTHNLRPHHTEAWVRFLSHGTRNRVPESGPSAPRVKLVVRLVERRVAGAAVVDARVRVVFVIFSGAGHFGAFLAEDTELFCWKG